MRAKLIPVNGGPEIELTKTVTVVGRKRGVCDICLDRPSVSKVHCVLVKTDGLLFVRDLGSTNGTKVNGQRVVRGALLPGDELAFAEARFRVFLGPDDPEQELAQAATQAMEVYTEQPGGKGSGAAEKKSSRAGSDLGLSSESDVRLLPADDE